MASTITTPIAGRIPNEHAHQIEALARGNGTTTSSIVAQIIAERLNTPEQQADHTLDDLDPVTEQTAVSPNIARARPTA
jgi:hypothetical protein